MKHKRQIEEIELKRKCEMQKAKQQLDKASLQHQVLGKETDCGGYIPPASNTSTEIALQFSLKQSSLLKGLLHNSQLFESLNDKNDSQPLQIAE